MDIVFVEVFSFLTREEVPWLLAGGLVLWAALSWVAFTDQMKLPRLSLIRARDRIASTGGPADFFLQYEAINEELTADPVLGHAWSEFTETLIIPSSAGGRIRNTARPEGYFNQSLLTKAGVNLRYFGALPNFLVGAGLLFTFLGLIAALFFASRGVGANVDVAIKALKDLLSAATFKFTTSIAGLGASIAFSLFQKKYLSRFFRLLDDFCGQLEQRVDFVSPVVIADQSQRELERQTSELQRFNTDLAVSIAEALDKRMGDTFARVLAPLAKQLEELSKGIGNANENALREMIDKFTQTIQGAAGKEITALADNLKDVGANLGNLIDGIKAANTGIQSELEQSAKKLSGQIGEAGDEVSRKLGAAGDEIAKRLGEAGEAFVTRIGATIDAFVEALTRFPEKMRPIEDGLSKLAQSVSSADEALSGTLAEVKESLVQMAVVTENFRSIGQPLQQTATSLTEGSVALREAADEIKSSQAAIASTAQQLKAVSESVISAVKSQADRFETLDGSLANVFTELQVGLENYQGTVEKFVLEMDRKMASAVDKLAAGIDELKDALEDAAPERVDA